MAAITTPEVKRCRPRLVLRLLPGCGDGLLASPKIIVIPPLFIGPMTLLVTEYKKSARQMLG